MEDFVTEVQRYILQLLGTHELQQIVGQGAACRSFGCLASHDMVCDSSRICSVKHRWVLGRALCTIYTVCALLSNVSTFAFVQGKLRPISGGGQDRPIDRKSAKSCKSAFDSFFPANVVRSLTLTNLCVVHINLAKST